MGRPPVSFIVPVYSRGGGFLAPCLESLLAAADTYGEAEILILNDQSPDDSASVMETFRARRPDRIRIVPSGERLGQALARAALTAEARGRYIIPFDHDDILLPFDLAASVDILERHPEFSGSYAGKYYFSGNVLEKRMDGGTFSYFRLLVAPRVNINAAILRKDEIAASGGFQRLDSGLLTPGEDVLLLANMALRKELLYEPFAPRCLYRMHPGQLTQSLAGELWKTRSQLLNHFSARYPGEVDDIMNGRLPDVSGPESGRRIMMLLGAIGFARRKEYDFAVQCCNAGLKRHPEDYGVWLQLLHLASDHGRKDLLDSVLPEAMFRFRNDPYVLLEFSFAEMGFYEKNKIPAPSPVLQRCRNLYDWNFHAVPLAQEHPLFQKK